MFEMFTHFLSIYLCSTTKTGQIKADECPWYEKELMSHQTTDREKCLIRFLINADTLAVLTADMLSQHSHN